MTNGRHVIPAARHHHQDICKLATEAVIVNLPPHYPDFHPLEMAFAKTQRQVARHRSANYPDLWQAIADALRRFTSQGCANCLAAAGYDAKRKYALVVDTTLVTMIDVAAKPVRIALAGRVRGDV